jgi:hypothetical protein
MSQDRAAFPLMTASRIPLGSRPPGGGYCVSTDVTADPAIIPTAGNSVWRRAVVIECL